MKIHKNLNFFVSPKHIANVTETGEVTAIFGDTLDYIKLIAKGLGCSYKVYSDEILKRHTNRDFYIGGVPITISNYPFMSSPYTYSDITFATEKPPFKVTTFAPLQPFSLSVWIGLLLCVIFASFLYFLIFWRKIPLMTAFFYILGTLFGEHHNWRPKSMAQKMLILTWSIGIMFITLSYGSVLLSILTVPVREKGITDFDGLYEAVRLKQATAVTFRHSGLDDRMAEIEETKLSSLGWHIKYQDKINNYNALQKIKKNVAVIGNRRILSYKFLGDRYFISEDSILPSYSAIFDFKFEKYSYMKRVNDVIHRIWAAGINTKLYDDKALKHTLHNLFNLKDRITVQDTIRPLSLADLSGAFYFLVIGHILGLICFVFEILAQHCPCKI